MSVSDLTINRIKDKLQKIYEKIITEEENNSSNNAKESWLSRAYTAYIVNMLGEGNVTLEESASYITDGYDDCGIDAIFFNKEKKILHFVQTKFRKSKGISEGDLLKFVSGVEKIINSDFKNFNDKIRKQASMIEEWTLDFDTKIKLVIALGNNNNISKKCISIIDEYFKKNYTEEDTFTYDVIKLNDVYNHMANIQIGNSITIDNFILENYGTLKNNDDTIMYYGIVQASVLAELKEKYGNRLLEKNIRNFKSNSDVNNGIIKTLKEEPENFCIYNNGVKIIAEKIERPVFKANNNSIVILKLEGASIINGAQTTGCIFEVSKQDQNLLNNAKVYVQIISLSNLDCNIGDKITKLSNTQNKIENKDFAVQDIIQEKLRKDLAIDGYTYIYKQGMEDIKNQCTTCSLDEATISLGCYNEDINISTTIKRAYGSVFDDLSKPPYKTIFNPNTSAHCLWNTVQILRKVTELQNNKETFKNDKKLKLVVTHGNRMILHLIFSEIKKEYKKIETDYIQIKDNKLNSIYKKNYL